MLICDKCGKQIEVTELKVHKQVHGYTSLGQPLEEEFTTNECSCGGEFCEASKCKKCGTDYLDTELLGVCECCLDDNADLDTALKIGDENRDCIEVNGFFASQFDEETINKILIEYVNSHKDDAEIKKKAENYCKDDLLYFADWITDKNG